MDAAVQFYTEVLGLKLSNHFGDQILNATLDGSAPKLFYSVTRKSSDGTVYLKLVNASSTPQPLRLQFKGASTIEKTGKLITLSAKTTAATNSITQPTGLCRWRASCTTQRLSLPTLSPASPFRFWS